MLLFQRSRELPSSKFKLRGSISKLYSSFSSPLSLCNNPQLLHQIHSRFIIHGLHQNSSLSSELITRYSNLGCLNLSIKLFDSIDDPNASLCITMLRILSSHQKYENTLIIFRQIMAKYLFLDETAYLCVIRACSNLSSIEAGLQVHSLVQKLGFEAHLDVGTSLVYMYGRHGAINDARQVFEQIPVKNLTSWNEVMSVFTKHDGKESWILFKRLRLEGFVPDSSTIICLLRLCIDLNCLEMGRSLHLLIILYNLVADLSIMTALLTMYCKFGSLEAARLLFDKIAVKDLAVWNVMISGYSQSMHPKRALELLRDIAELGLRPDLFTAIASLTAVTQLKSLEFGQQLHGAVIRHESDCQISVHNSLIEMYSLCGNPEKSRIIFDSLERKTMVSWSSMIKGYVSNELPLEALLLFKDMGTCGVRADTITLINVLPACVSSGALEQVKNVQVYSIKQGLNLLISVNTALLVSYAKCGCIEMAQKLFDEGDIELRDIMSWNSIIGAYSKHGYWKPCFKLYEQLKESEVLPNQVTFLALLTACVNSGLVTEGWACFSEMVDKFSIQPGQEHYACMVDLLGRSGHLEAAVNVIEKMPFKADVRVWGPLLSACKLHKEASLAEFAAWKLIELEPENAANYVLLSNIYASAGNWEGVAKMRNGLKGKSLKKMPGYSWLEINGQVHEFRVMDQSHSESGSIYNMLKVMEQDIESVEDIC
ncbi:hypothetical protein IEQ34_026537 [Dendrobium chrysotoxum]|uniref:Pentatricopeptide repeat-containing protein n=1 Tax=Dendrobium chrysotoxum TaxID=161865 RepID=A0AAV7FLY6_DENCH|nr:hypothetical protein IEQ34_026537 [Dendrobium chrysotoxum]